MPQGREFLVHLNNPNSTYQSLVYSSCKQDCKYFFNESLSVMALTYSESFMSCLPYSRFSINTSSMNVRLLTFQSLDNYKSGGRHRVNEISVIGGRGTILKKKN